jgi:hypothetical protein
VYQVGGLAEEFDRRAVCVRMIEDGMRLTSGRVFMYRSLNLSTMEMTTTTSRRHDDDAMT